jgi:hypothetical protein
LDYTDKAGLTSILPQNKAFLGRWNPRTPQIPGSREVAKIAKFKTMVFLASFAPWRENALDIDHQDNLLLKAFAAWHRLRANHIFDRGSI